MQTDFDVLIVGGGPVGASLALALAKQPLKIGIIEAKSAHTPSSDQRALALAQSSKRIFATLGLWEKIAPQATPIQHIAVSEQGRWNSAQLTASKQGVDAFGYVINATKLNTILQQALQAQTTIHHYQAARLQTLTPTLHSNYLSVALDNVSVNFTAKLVVAADGTHSTVRTLANIAVKKAEYGQSALVTNVRLKQNHHFYAYERFTKTGSLALLPFTEQQSALIWIMPTATIESFKNITKQLFLQKLQNAFGYRLGRFIDVDDWQVYPLNLWRAQTLVKPGCVLIGNAAQTLHPIAAQGFNLGMRDVACLAQVIVEATRNGKNPGDFAELKKYQQWRKQDQAQTLAFTHGLVNLFASSFYPWVKMRNLGLAAFDNLPLIKHYFADKQMGLSGKFAKISLRDRLIMLEDNYDVIIIGGGVVGLTLAALLAKNPLKIAVIDSQTLPPAAEQNFDQRVSAINQASKNLLESLQAWPEQTSPYQAMQVWDASGNGDIRFSCTEVGHAALGYIVENSLLQSALRSVLTHYSHVDTVYATQVVALVRDSIADRIVLKLADGSSITTQLLVGADGANSWVRGQCHIDLTSRPYQQSALVTAVRTSQPHQLTAWQCFLPTGTLAFLPLADPHVCSIVWSMTPAEAEQMQAAAETVFEQALAQAFAFRLGSVQLLAKRVIYPLIERHAKHYVQDNVALVGDAIHTIHPLAGQGLNLGLADAACLAKVISHALAKKTTIGNLLTLRPYERQRRGENLAVIAAMAGFKRLFTDETKTARFARNFGLRLVDKVLPLKKFFIKQAMGLGKDKG